MQLRLIPTITLAALLPCAALAQSSSTNPGMTSPANAPSAQGGTANGQQMAAKLASVSKVKQDLQNAGFRDVQVVAEAFVVRAKTKDGDPVIMTMGPHGFTALEAMNGAGGGGAMTGTQSGMQSITVQRLNGMNLYDGEGNKLGDVERVVGSGEGRDSVVIGHGGFLGMGEKQVAVPLDNVVMRGDRLITNNLSNDQIRSMPEWKRGQQADLEGSRTVQVRHGS